MALMLLSPSLSGLLQPSTERSKRLSRLATASECMAGLSDFPTALSFSILSRLFRDTVAVMPVSRLVRGFPLNWAACSLASANVEARLLGLLAAINQSPAHRRKFGVRAVIY